MSLKILGGVARQFNLATPHTLSTRPTSVMLKRRLFDSVQNFEDKIFVDLCAGSGSIGLEALSRGAKAVYLIEKNKNAFRFLKQNAQAIQKKFPDLGDVLYQAEDFAKWMKKNDQVLARGEEELYVFFDPPYEQLELYEQFFSFRDKIKAPARLVVEACQQKTLPLDQFEQKFGAPSKVFKQGTSFFAIYDL